MQCGHGSKCDCGVMQSVWAVCTMCANGYFYLLDVKLVPAGDGLWLLGTVWYVEESASDGMLAVSGW